MNASPYGFSKITLIICALLLFIITFLTYLPSLRNGFVWDDEKYILQNTHIHRVTSTSLRWMGTSSYASNWHPLTWLSHALDLKLWGLTPSKHRMTNLALHGCNASLVFLLTMMLFALARPIPPHPTLLLISGMTASLLFALHPLRVESVVWIAERKDLLCAFFT